MRCTACEHEVPEVDERGHCLLCADPWLLDPCDPDAPDGDLCTSCLAGRHDRDRIEEDL